jgi:hypothetical protein
VETFRCPVCIGVLRDARAHRCGACGQNMRRRRPRVLGEETRVGAENLPIDRWMLERLHGSTHGRRRSSLPPVAWHGKFTTTPLAEPDFSATPSPVATPLAPPTIGVSTTTARPDEPEVDIETPATVGALALDVYTRPVAPPEEIDDAPVIAPVPELDESAAAIDAEVIPTYEVPVATEPPVSTTPRPVPHEELDPDVRALVDELYQQARAELSGNDLAFFAPLDDTPAVPAATEVEPAPPTVDRMTTVEPTTSAPIINDPAPPNAPNAPAAPEPPAPSGRSGWVPAFTPNERRRRQSTD